MSLQLRCNYSAAAAQVLWEGEGSEEKGGRVVVVGGVKEGR